MPTSAARCRAACPPTRARSPRRGSSSRRRASTTRRSTRSSRRCATRTSGAAIFAPSSRAQRLGARRIAELCARQGRDAVAAAMDELVAYSERRVRAGIAALPDGRYEAIELLETATASSSCVSPSTVAGDELELDFAGTAPQHDGNLNCPLAVTVSACLFVVRCLTDPDAPGVGGRARAGDRPRARGLPRERTSAGRGRRRQRRDVEPDRRPALPRLRRRRCRCRRRDRGR